MTSFFSLSAELRNRVYDYLLDEPDDEKLLWHRPGAPSLPSALSPMQVNRQLRAEFRPCFLRYQRIAVTLQDFSAYLFCWYGQGQGTTDQHARLSIFGPVYNSGPLATLTVDLMRLVHLLCDSPATFEAALVVDGVTDASRAHLASQLRYLQLLLLGPYRRDALRRDCGRAEDGKAVVALKLVIEGHAAGPHTRPLSLVYVSSCEALGQDMPASLAALANLGIRVREY